ncbi:E3 ubiquitin-protein ligase MYLIP-like [Crassostrea virginica]
MSTTKLWCLVSQPNSVVLEVEVDQRANGQECLEKICEKLGIDYSEKDYFGLQYKGNKGENLWLNMRNQISRQLSGPQPFRFQLRVKFFVQPHMLLQDTTRHQFYLQICMELKAKKLLVSDEDQLVRILALMAQAEHGNQAHSEQQILSYQNLMHGITSSSEEIQIKLAYEHAKYRGMRKLTSEYKVVQEASALPGYGMEYHEAKNEGNEDIHVGVGPEGVVIYDTDMTEMSRFPYPIVQKAVHNGRKCLLCVFNEDGETTHEEFKMVSSKAAIAMYRSITEMHSFFRCDTINSEVFSQVSQDLKGVLASIFLKENNSVGMNYVFDVQHTFREVYDSTKRKMFMSQQSLDDQGQDHAECEMETSCESRDISENIQEYKSQLQKIQECFVCRVCMDKEISTTLCPCGHMVCCTDCASRLEECPVCRTGINKIQPVFLPTQVTTASR